MLACAESRTEDTETVEVIVDGDREIRLRASQVEVLVELGSPDGGAWQLTQHLRFEPNGAKSWPLQFDAEVTTGPNGTKCQLRAIARDERAAVIAQAETARSCERAAADGLHATLKFASDRMPVEPTVPDEPDGPTDPIEVCVGREPNAPFCDGEVMRVCNQRLSEVTVRPCAENERCYESSGNVSCACRPGFVMTEGGCEAPSNCPNGDAGCDP